MEAIQRFSWFGGKSARPRYPPRPWGWGGVVSIKCFWGRDEGVCPAAVGLEGSLERTSTGKILVSALLGEKILCS